jgi:hypothetical protein
MYCNLYYKTFALTDQYISVYSACFIIKHLLLLYQSIYLSTKSLQIKVSYISDLFYYPTQWKTLHGDVTQSPYQKINVQ